MKRLATATLAVAFFVFVPAALAAQPSIGHKALYRAQYKTARHRFGAAAVGCDLISGPGRCPGNPTDRTVLWSIGILERMLAPRVALFGNTATTSSTSSSYTTSGSCGGTTPYSGAGQCWAIPYSVVSCESGGQNVPNTQGSGAMGYYQLKVGGTGSRASQDAAAAALWNGGAGASNWTCAR